MHYQLSRLHALEGHHEEVKQELEKSIQALRNQIAKYDADYGKNMEVLTGIADNLMNLLRNVRKNIFSFNINFAIVVLFQMSCVVRVCAFPSKGNNEILYVFMLGNFFFFLLFYLSGGARGGGGGPAAAICGCQ